MKRTAEGPCPLCGTRTLVDVLAGYDRQHPGCGSFRYGRCTGCGVVRQDPLPGPEEIPSFYPEDYAPHAATSGKREGWLARLARRHYYDVESVGRSGLLRALLGSISSRVMPGIRPPRGRNRVLDVGCGAGSLLRRYQSLGWDARGIEVNPGSCRTARAQGLEVHQGTVFDAPYERGSFDLVILRHVIEHVPDPVSFLRAAGGFLAPAGVLELLTPNAGGLGFWLYGSCWYPLDAPRHLLLFDARSIRLLGERAGLRLARLSTAAGARQLYQSHRYKRTQGIELPEGLEERRRLIVESARSPRPRRVLKRVVRLVSAASALVQRGETLEVEFLPRIGAGSPC